MSPRNKVPFGDLLLDSKDGEWGEGAPGVGLLAADMIRGTDFAELNSSSKVLPRRYVNERHVARKRLQVGDIVFEMAGGTAKQSTGRSALVTQAFLERRTDTPVLCASFCRHLRLDQTKYDPKFVYYLLQTLYGAGYMSVFNIQHTGVSRFQYTSFKKHTVLDMPGLATQQKIAAILSAYDDLIANNQRRITLLERMGEDIYREWFVRLRFPGHDQVKIEKGVPQGWRFAELSEMATINSASLKKSAQQDRIQYIDISAVTTNHIAELTEIALADAPGRARRLVKHGDVIWSSVRPANRAYCLIYEPPENLIASTGFAVISPKPSIPFTFINFAVTSDSYVEQMAMVAKGSAYPATSFDDFGKAKVLRPSTDLLERFHALCEPMFRRRHQLREANTALAKLRDALLPRLISGKLAVDALDIRFPPGMAPPAA